MGREIRYIYSKNSTVIRYNYKQKCDKTHTYFGLFRPPSGGYSTKENTIIVSSVIDLNNFVKYKQ